MSCMDFSQYVEFGLGIMSCLRVFDLDSIKINSTPAITTVDARSVFLRYNSKSDEKTI